MRRVRWAAFGLVLWMSAVVHADASVTRGAATAPGWCLARYLKEASRAAPASALPAPGKIVPFDLAPAKVQVELPDKWLGARIDGTLAQLGPVAVEGDAFTGWEPTLQLRWQSRAELETRIKAIISDFMGTTRPQIEVRAAKLGGKPVEELCAIVRRTAGHATTLDGVHHAMPDIVELVHGYLFTLGGKTLTAVYRLPPQFIDQQSLFERVLASLRF